MAHEISGHRPALERLRSNDRSRYGTVRLVVTRNRFGDGTVSVVVRNVAGGVLRDTRLFAGRVDLSPGTPESVDVYAALTAALKVAVESARP